MGAQPVPSTECSLSKLRHILPVILVKHFTLGGWSYSLLKTVKLVWIRKMHFTCATYYKLASFQATSLTSSMSLIEALRAELEAMADVWDPLRPIISLLYACQRQHYCSLYPGLPRQARCGPSPPEVGLLLI